MKRLAVIAVAVLVGCAANPPQPPRAVNIQPNVMVYQPGTGTVQRVFATPAQASLQRLEVRMDSGLVQYIDTDSTEFARGTRIALSDDRMIRKL